MPRRHKGFKLIQGFLVQAGYTLLMYEKMYELHGPKPLCLTRYAVCLDMQTGSKQLGKGYLVDLCNKIQIILIYYQLK